MMTLFEEGLRLNLEESMRFLSLLLQNLYDHFTLFEILIIKPFTCLCMLTVLCYTCRHDIRISIIGDRRGLPESFIEVITEAEKKTKANTRLHVILAINYGGQSEIVEACKRVCKKVKNGLIEEEEINNKIFEQELWTNVCPEFPFPDMLIRFSGEQRLSDFLAYQLAYAELYSPKTLFPDFGEEDFVMAMKHFQERQRRFGGGK